MRERWRWGVFLATLDPAVGTEQAGTRPVVVVSEENFNELMDAVTVLPITRKSESRRVYYNEASLPAGNGGLKADSVVLAHQVRSISKRRLIERWGTLESTSTKEAVFRALLRHLGVDADEPEIDLEAAA